MQQDQNEVPSANDAAQTTPPADACANIADTATPGAMASDVYCVGCGYDIAGIAPESRCPECGFAIAESLKPEIRGFGGILSLRSFRVGLWMLALFPLAIGGIAVPQRYDGIRNSFIQHIFNGGPHVPSRWYSTPQWVQASQRLDWWSLSIAGLFTTLMVALLCWRPNRLRKSIESTLARPRLISVRTGLIAFGCVLSMLVVGTCLVWDMVGRYSQSLTAIMSVVSIVVFGALLWWLIAVLNSGRMRIALIVALAFMMIAMVLEITARMWIHDFNSFPRALAYTGLAIFALSAGLLWRWLARGFRRPVLAITATAYATTAPVAILWTGALLDEVVAGPLFMDFRRHGEGLLGLLAASIVVSSAALGVIAILQIGRIKTASAS